MLKLKESTTEEIDAIKKASKKDGLCFNKNTKHLSIYLDNTYVGCLGYMLTFRKAIYKNDFVFPEYRNKRIYEKAFKLRDQIVLSLGIKTVEATCTNMSIKHYLKNGYKPIVQYAKYTKVRNEDISKQNCFASS